MNFFKNLVLSVKIERGTLKNEDFNYLCEMYQGLDPDAQVLLTKFFSTKAPRNEMVHSLYAEENAMAYKLYLECIRNRHLSEEEQLMLVRFAPVDGTFRFPHPLDDAALCEIFVVRKHDIAHMRLYVGTYALPSSYEIKLIELAKQYGEVESVYAGILEKYIRECPDPIFVDEESQSALMNFNHSGIRELIAKACNLEDMFLSDEMVRIMIEDGNMSALRIALYGSRIASDELRELIVDRFPYLRTAVEISEIRYRLYKDEKSLGIFCGVATPSTHEKSFLSIRHDTYLDGEFEEMLAQELRRPDVTVYLLVWAADKYPHLESTAVRRLRMMSVK